MIENYTKGIKAFNKDRTCRGFKFKEGEIYEIEGELELCENGFHFSPYIACTLDYYPNLDNNVYAEVEALGEIIYEQPLKLKAVTNKIKIVRFLSEKEVKIMFDKNNNTGNNNTGYCNTGNNNTGDRNTGYCNTGDWNTGDRNTGDNNTGDNNTGDRNTGYCNTGNNNTGNRNTGNCNTGNRNTGYCNTGDWNTGNNNTGYKNTGGRNTGNWNTGYRNAGNRNTGNCNTGNNNTGYCNTGDWNTGYCNTGDWNTGNNNTGYKNTGGRNTGDWNTGDWNTGNNNTGFFNTNTPKTIRIFNKEVNKREWDSCDKPNFIYFPIDNEQGYKGSFIKAYNDADIADKIKIFNIPNFNKELFFEISGIDVTELEEYLK